MMATDEVGTLAALKHHRQFVFNPVVVQRNGRIIKLIGDGTLVEFSSVVDAVNCARFGATCCKPSRVLDRELSYGSASISAIS